MGAALAKLAVGTSRWAMGLEAHAELAGTVEASSSVADMMEDFVFYLVSRYVLTVALNYPQPVTTSAIASTPRPTNPPLFPSPRLNSAL
jgi:hypothetical protein